MDREMEEENVRIE